MVELLTQPPPPEAIARMTAIEGVRVTPTVVATQEGPDRHLGPEIDAAHTFVTAGAALAAAETVTGSLR